MLFYGNMYNLDLIQTFLYTVHHKSDYIYILCIFLPFYFLVPYHDGLKRLMS